MHSLHVCDDQKDNLSGPLIFRRAMQAIPNLVVSPTSKNEDGRCRVLSHPVELQSAWLTLFTVQVANNTLAVAMRK